MQNKERSKDFWLFIVILLLAAGVRAIPEFRGGYWPIGYDTLNTYIPDLVKFDGSFWRWLSSANLLYFLLWPFYKLFHVDPNYVIKFAGSAIFGVLAASFYTFSRKFLKLDRKYSFLAAVLLIFQIPTLRISWDLFRNMLGLVFLFPALYALQTNHKTKNLILVGIFSLLVVLSHQLVATIWFIILAVYLINRFSDNDRKGFFKLLLASLPAVIMFIFVLKSPGANSFGGHVFYETESGRLFNYFADYKQTVSYQDLSKTISNLFFLCYIYLLPLAAYGFWLLRKNIILTIMTTWLLLGTFSSLIFGGFGLFVWDRWMIMLVFPMVIYAVYGLKFLSEAIAKSGWFQKISFAKALKVFGFLAVIAYCALFVVRVYPFLTAEYDDSKKPFLDKTINAYFPPTMVHNAVGYENIKAVLACILYLDRKMPEGSIILIDNRYRGLVLTWLDHSKRYVYSYPWSQNINETIIKKLREDDTAPVFTIWNSQEDLAGFKRMYYSGLAAAYRDKTTYASYLQRTAPSMAGTADLTFPEAMP